mgnify:CR=1 FL=1
MVEAWIEDAIARYERPLVRYAARIVGAERARDVVQDTFARLFEADRETLSDRVPEWLYRVCRNRALDLVRKDARRERLRSLVPQQAEEASPAERAEHRQTLRLALAAVDRLPPKQASVLRLKLHEGLSYQEIAERTGLTTSHVGYLLHHALRAVRDELGRDSDA